jgi:murein DD-endopeptidase MepM/ murein hydrolase activator NlpD
VKFHTGIDLKASLNQSVYATADGDVIEIGYQAGLGNFIKIKHLLGFETIYGHLNNINVAINDKVYQGQAIGFCGSTGSSTGVHLHYSVLRFKGFINPLGVM